MVSHMDVIKNGKNCYVNMSVGEACISAAVWKLRN